MAGANVVLETATFNWTYTHQSGQQPTEFRLKWGTAPGTYTNTKPYAYTAAKTDLVKNVVPGPGQYYAVMVVANAVGEGSKSTELPFVAASGLPMGSITFSLD